VDNNTLAQLVSYAQIVASIASVVTLFLLGAQIHYLSKQINESKSSSNKQINLLSQQIEESKLLSNKQINLLSQQIEESNRTQKTSQYLSSLQIMSDWRSEIIQNEDLAKRFIEDYDLEYLKAALNEGNAKSYFHRVQLFHILELFFILQENKVIDPKMWQGWDRQSTILIESDKNRQIWKSFLSKTNIFHPDFEEYINKKVVEVELQTKVKSP
jgi:hypothetical protein